MFYRSRGEGEEKGREIRAMKIHSPDPFVLTPLPLPRAFGAVMEKYISMQRGGGAETVFSVFTER